HTRSKRDWSSDVCSSDLKFLSFKKSILNFKSALCFFHASTGSSLSTLVHLNIAFQSLSIASSVDTLGNTLVAQDSVGIETILHLHLSDKVYERHSFKANPEAFWKFATL